MAQCFHSHYTSHMVWPQWQLSNHNIFHTTDRDNQKYYQIQNTRHLHTYQTPRLKAILFISFFYILICYVLPQVQEAIPIQYETRPDTRHQTTEYQANSKGPDLTRSDIYQMITPHQIRHLPDDYTPDQTPDTKQKGYQATCTGPDTNPTRCRIPTPYRPCVYTPLSSLDMAL